jgi:hypothetical protein
VALWLFSTLIRLVVYSEARTKTATNIHWSSYVVGLSLVFGLLAFIFAALLLLLSQFIATLILLSILALNRVFFKSHFNSFERKISESGLIEDNDLAIRLGYKVRDKGAFFVNVVDRPIIESFDGQYKNQTEWRENKSFYSEWLVIENDHIIVNPGHIDVSTNDGIENVSYDTNSPRMYAWNGCTPKFRFLWFIAGTPDLWTQVIGLETTKGSVRDKRFMVWKAAYRASLIHDALYQYLYSIPIDVSEVDKLFYRHLVKDGVPSWLASVYYLAVKLGGAKDVKNAPDGKFTRQEQVKAEYLSR